MFRSLSVLVLFVLFINKILCRNDKNVQKDCAAEIGYDRAVDPLRYMDSDGKIKRNFKCYITCKSIASHIITENGRLRTKLIIKILPSNLPERDKVITDFRSCSRQSSYLGSTDKCDVGFITTVCLARKNLTKTIENTVKDLKW